MLPISLDDLVALQSEMHFWKSYREEMERLETALDSRWTIANRHWSDNNGFMLRYERDAQREASWMEVQKILFTAADVLLAASAILAFAPAALRFVLSTLPRAVSAGRFGFEAVKQAGNLFVRRQSGKLAYNELRMKQMLDPKIPKLLDLGAKRNKLIRDGIVNSGTVVAGIYVFGNAIQLYSPELGPVHQELLRNELDPTAALGAFEKIVDKRLALGETDIRRLLKAFVLDPVDRLMRSAVDGKERAWQALDQIRKTEGWSWDRLPPKYYFAYYRQVADAYRGVREGIAVVLRACVQDVDQLRTMSLAAPK